MKKSSTDWNKWHQDLAKALHNTDQTNGLTMLLYALENLVDASSGLVTKYVTGEKPEITHQRLLACESKQLQISSYSSGAYLLDPFYRLAYDLEETGIFTLKQVAPSGFTESEYYRRFYSQLDIQDEVCLIIRPECDVIFSISLARLGGKVHFSAQEVLTLETVFSVVQAILTNWYLANNSRKKDQLSWQLDEALKQFGSSVLTKKECEVLHLTLQGYSVKSIADKLENAIETIKYHRKNLYRKLDINSQPELFNLFITALKELPIGLTVDPLTLIK
ncbi:helix-turn-helix transcriptional regulator [Colwellia psychrerythraea]|uniref:Transcriptional regulator, LuxR family n=1 Tax=Colwellia psychrerythraea TaxID=28229 RepID=A0A099KFV6_COLPS|nr:helix-turn-helix domain-containing protein [Colwellia psychrerythraea]KGJ88902.1 transcriptional regulator, LuxR family [Colwellia psychrerythraea]